jgi:hypothetical protein
MRAPNPSDDTVIGPNETFAILSRTIGAGRFGELFEKARSSEKRNLRISSAGCAWHGDGKCERFYPIPNGASGHGYRKHSFGREDKTALRGARRSDVALDHGLSFDLER